MSRGFCGARQTPRRSPAGWPRVSCTLCHVLLPQPTVSGWAIDRPGWKECKGYLREGDTLHVHSIDRLARNLEDL
ncbi:MAG: recombinase family protein, partial [Desulfovibrio sp.]|nr:recombinase family protein [Desulfovibrio sp.]